MSGDRFHDHAQRQHEPCCCDQRSIVKTEERGLVFLLENPDRHTICKIKMDGCFLNTQTTQCDYLLWIPDRRTVYLVELKGSDLQHAMEQITTTWTAVEADLTSCVVHARIVLNRVPVPDIKSTALIRLKRNAAATQGSFSFHGNKKHSEPLV